MIILTIIVVRYERKKARAIICANKAMESYYKKMADKLCDPSSTGPVVTLPGPDGRNIDAANTPIIQKSSNSLTKKENEINTEISPVINNEGESLSQILPSDNKENCKGTSCTFKTNHPHSE